MSNLTDHAWDELERAGMFDDDSDYGGMIGDAVMEIMTAFSKHGHSGSSAHIVLSILERLLRYEPLTQLTDDPAEWNEVEMGGAPCWQSRRMPSAFSRDGGKRFYDVSDNDQITRPTQPRDESPKPWEPMP